MEAPVRTTDTIALVLAATFMPAPHFPAARDAQSDTIISLERAALDRWGKGDPQGYLDTYAPDVTYFDPMQEKRVDGRAALKELYGPLTGKISIDHYEMIGTKVQRHGDVAVLTFNLVSHAKRPTGEPLIVRWNSTEVYARSQGRWRIIHSHWSFTRPG